MESTFIGVRNVDQATFRKFKAMTAEERMRLGEALSQAMRLMLEQKKERQKKFKGQFLKVKPFDFGKGTEQTSKEIDRMLYGS